MFSISGFLPFLPPSKKIQKKSCISCTNALDFLCFLTVSDVGQGVGYIKKVQETGRTVMPIR